MVTDIAMNLIKNSGGIYESMISGTMLPDIMKAVADRISSDDRAMVDRYEVEYAGDGSLQQPRVEMIVTRPGVRLHRSPQRPF
jgi:hypothetical protein